MHFEETNLRKLKPISIGERDSKVRVQDIVDPARAVHEGSAAGAILSRAMPDVLASTSLKAVVRALIEARDERREIVWLVGAHVIKCGLSTHGSG